MLIQWGRSHGLWGGSDALWSTVKTTLFLVAKEKAGNHNLLITHCLNEQNTDSDVSYIYFIHYNLK